ncbi:MAG: hypothetical protein A3H72_00315 [Candidatus Doudnabacteria bacterium RIFCSPLOWO2_02_FULL_48_8]|uniref:Uncharacterized protein n=1 Tax=Candidatus Doudnabacteria bacterium RIFCSPHIGHO2_01_FULL_46_24 TaxID=1817825 RepID=A0A1F5NW65_9BACT|nr:MAG: hypothetical protein A2720_03605 [Candidatus Doudnabacteria bacterium RIFCSPHIGHO2_01_FULL_46_24]OGE95309.1 MAG: hypothetical protein A3H72_00315 [Candidatus Doudnabacteria bacterium RIFCSPLOWO2_02_FULL_48_8]OGE95613.1 MAG: hypothetical protein A3E98_01280 [Candidatus Doudnabacteria bacterium RIFCSPHIGHO2_12_FULL_48_11]
MMSWNEPGKGGSMAKKHKSEVGFEILPDGSSRGKTHFWKFVDKQTRTEGLNLAFVEEQICKLLEEIVKRDGIVAFYAEEPVAWFQNLAENIKGEDIQKLAEILCCDPKVLEPILVASRKQINKQLKKAGIDPAREALLAWAGF